MGVFLEFLFETAAGTAGLLGVFMLIGCLGLVLWFGGIAIVIGCWYPYCLFTEDRDFRVRPHRVVIAWAVLVPLTVGLFMIHWWLPLAACTVFGLGVMALDYFGL